LISYTIKGTDTVITDPASGPESMSRANEDSPSSLL